MKYSPEQKTKLKNTPITNYLHSIGIEPISISGGRLVYSCPIKDEQTPSFMVHPATNKFKCFGCEQKGDIFELVTQIEKLDFIATLDRLASINPDYIPYFSFIGQASSKSNIHTNTSNGLELINVKPLQSHEWQAYVIGRGIPLEVAEHYLNEVKYQNGRYIYDAVGFKTDNSGFAIRSPKGKGFKAFIGQSFISTIYIAGSSKVNLFEGFFDYLSALTYHKLLKPSFTTVVLNSTANLKQTLGMLQVAKSINCYLDNDTSGRATLTRLQKLRLPVIDRSTVYHNFKDFNEMIQQSII